MTAMDRETGFALDVNSARHLEQSIGDILTTPRGSRPMRRDYGSDLPDLLDMPNHGPTRLRIFAAAALALQRWEPRLRLRRVTLDGEGSSAVLRLRGVRVDLPRSPVTGRPAFDVSLPVRLAPRAA